MKGIKEMSINIEYGRYYTVNLSHRWNPPKVVSGRCISFDYERDVIELESNGTVYLGRISNIVESNILHNIMTPKEFEDKMKLIRDDSKDEEDCHFAMDALMCGLLCDLGYKKGIKIFEETDKWYS